MLSRSQRLAAEPSCGNLGLVTGRYRPGGGDARPWLYGIATNLIGRHRRAEIRLYRALARTGADPVTEPFTERVDDRLSADHAGRQLAAALARLSADRQLVAAREP